MSHKVHVVSGFELSVLSHHHRFPELFTPSKTTFSGSQILDVLSMVLKPGQKGQAKGQKGHKDVEPHC